METGRQLQVRGECRAGSFVVWSMTSKGNYKGWVTVAFGMSLIVVGLLIASSLAGAVSISGSHQDSGTQGRVPAGTITVTLTTNRSGNEVDYGASILFEVTPTGSSYTYSWSGLGLLTCPASQNVSDLDCVDSYNGNAIGNVEVTVTDHAGDSGSAIISLTVVTDPTVSQPTASVGNPPNWTDVGQYYNLTATITGGVSPFISHVTSSTGLNCTNSTSSYTINLYCIPKTIGNYTVFVNITDADGFKASTRQTFRIYSAISVSASQSPSWIEVNQTFTLTATATGGNASSGYSYNWGRWTWCSGSKTLTCKAPSSGLYGFTVSACNYPKFGSVCTLTRTSIWVLVNPGPSTYLTTNRTGDNTDVGLPISLVATTSGGTGVYALNYTGLPPGCTSKNSSALSCTPIGAGTYTVVAKATDTLGFNATAKVNITVYAYPSVTPPSPSVPTIDVGQSVTFTASATGGAPNSTVSWIVPTILGCSSSNTLTLHCVSKQPGQYDVTVRVVDTNGGAVTATTTYTVYPDPSTSISDSRPSADVGQAVTFTAHPTNGTGHYLHFTWNSTKGSGIWGWFNCTPSTGPTLNCTAGGAGYVSVTVNVTDTNGVTSSFTQILYFINGDAYAPSLSCSPTTAPVADWVTCSAVLNATITDGAYPYTLTWTNSNELNCTVVGSNPNGTIEYYRCLTEDVGVASVGVRATDTNGWTSQVTTTTVTVTMELSLSATAGNQSANENGTLKDNGAEVAFLVYLQGGTAPWTCELTENDSTSTLATTQTASGQCSMAYVWPHGGTYIATVTVKDSAGNQVSGWILVDASPPGTNPSGGVVLHTLIAQAGSYGAQQNGTLKDDGTLVSFIAYFDGGTGPYACTLTQNGSDSALTNSQSAAGQCSVTYTWPHGGTYIATLTVTDSADIHSSAWILVDATGSSTGLTNNVVLEGLGAQAGSSTASRNGTLRDNSSAVTITATFRNGTGPYTCALTQNGSSTALANAQSSGASCSLTYTWRHGGTYVATVTVTDSAGTRSSGWVVVDVVVSGNSNASPSSSAWPSWWWVIPLAAVTVVVILAVMVVLSARRKAPPTASEMTKTDSVNTPTKPEDPPDWFEEKGQGEDHAPT